MIYLKPKNAGDVVDYTIDLKDYMPTGVSLRNVEVSVTSSGTGESPLSLEVVGSPALQSDVSPPIGQTEVLFWLSGGTSDEDVPSTNYRLKIQFSDDQSDDPDRTYVRYAQIEVRNDL